MYRQQPEHERVPDQNRMMMGTYRVDKAEGRGKGERPSGSTNREKGSRQTYRVTTEWMSHRKCKETKQQPATAGQGNILGCCLVYICLLCDIHSSTHYGKT